MNNNEKEDIVIYDIKDIQRILKIGKNNAYKLFQLPNFPIIKIGKKYLVPKEDFEKWIKNSLYKKLLQ